VTIAVHDDGIGMDDATRARAFDPFFTTKAPGVGTGLGLSTVYGIVKQCGGFVYIDSTPGRGTTFTIYLPERPVGSSAVRDVDPGPAEPPEASARSVILLVEDEAEVRSVVRRMLQDAGYIVLEAADVPEALVRLAEPAINVDLLLSDVVMPGGGGRVLLDTVRASLPSARVLLMSGYSEDAVIARGAFADEVTLLPKPFSRETLLDAVRRALGSSGVGAPAH
jgi:CheY-like chemotaxis protein